MASDYGLNFGFRRSDESMATREGRYKTPATGNALRLGTAVMIDKANDGYLKQCAANAAGESGLCGLLIQEESHIGDIFSNVPDRGHDSYDLGFAKKDQLSVIWAGVGTKVWFRNTPAYARGTRSLSAVTMLGSLSAVEVGDKLGWDGSKWVESDGSTTPHWLTVTKVAGSGSTNWYAEAVVRF